MNALVDFLHTHTPLPSPVARFVVLVSVVAAAWVLGRAAARAAAWLVAHGERRGGGTLARRKERETAISLVQTSVRYAVWTIALALCFAASFGRSDTQAVVGASFFAIVIGFAAQRFLIDLIAGLVMFFERWFRVGDSVQIEPWKVQGVVEEVGLRAVVVRGAGGELQRVHNSQVLAVRLYPRGYREAEIEFVVRDAERARSMVEDEIVPMLPVEPTRFVRPPELVDCSSLSSGLAEVRMRVAVVPGREWLAEELVPSLVKELSNGQLVHGPVVNFVDEVAQRRFGRLALVAAGRSNGSGG